MQASSTRAAKQKARLWGDVKQDKGNQGMKLHELSFLFHVQYFPQRRWFFPSRCDDHLPKVDGFSLML
jgi:hypothetical protein